MHVFEKAQLGKAPFRVADYQVMTVRQRSGNGFVERASGCCDYCGTTIRHAYTIQGSCGETFKVGSSCVAKVDPAMASEMKIMRRDAERAAREARREARQAEVNGLFEAMEAYGQKRAPEFFNRVERDGSYIKNFDAVLSFGVICAEEYLQGRRITADEQKFAWKIKNAVVEAVKNHVDELDRAEKDAEKSRHQNHVGNVGAKIEVQARHIGSFSYETQWGLSWVRKFEDTDGNLLVWFTGSSPKWFSSDFNGILRATVKDHGHRDGEAQTIITRPSGKAA